MTGVLLTGVGKRYDIVCAFAQHATVVAADPNPLAPAQYAAHACARRRRASTTRATCPRSPTLCDEHDVGAVVPLTDLDIEVLARARADGILPALVPDPEIARATYDKYETHLLLERHGPAVAADRAARASEPTSYPVMVKPRRGSRRALDPPRARRASEADVLRRATSTSR